MAHGEALRLSELKRQALGIQSQSEAVRNWVPQRDIRKHILNETLSHSQEVLTDECMKKYT